MFRINYFTAFFKTAPALNLEAFDAGILILLGYICFLKALKYTPIALIGLVQSSELLPPPPPPRGSEIMLISSPSSNTLPQSLRNTEAPLIRQIIGIVKSTFCSLIICQTVFGCSIIALIRPLSGWQGFVK